MMTQPEKWRETIDPYSIGYRNFKLKSVLGYPYARNDVFYVDIEVGGLSEKAFIKVGRTDIHDIKREVTTINSLDLDILPEIIEYDLSEPSYIVTRAVEGERLSSILKADPKESSFDYMDEYARYLSKFHRIRGDFPMVEDRKFFHIGGEDYFKKYNILDYRDYLLNNIPEKEEYTFVHGDCHYANILWLDRQVKVILDYELAGIGIKEFDMAWAIFLRPGQTFLNTMDEIEYFLKSYSKHNTYNRKSFNYYFVLIASHFYSIGNDEYRESIRPIMPF